VHRPETLWVNKKGERFINESMSMMAGRALMRQPGTIIWALFDSRAKEHMQATPSPRQVQMGGEGWLRTLGEDLEKEEGWTRKTAAIAGSLDELARKIEVNPEALRATVDRYNELCDQGRDADFVKPASLLMPLRTPPYRAVLGVRFCHGTSGGVRVNGRMEVSGRGGQRIEGLYATGDNTSGWVTEWGPPGTTLGFAFTSGYIAGEQAAAHLSRQRSMSTQTPR
jgi:fumarate reductase flavoprotein subunit